MLILLAILGVVFAINTLVAVKGTRRLCRVLKHNDPDVPSRTHWPSAMIVLSLRGADPRLEETIRRLLRQDYPHFSLRIVVDHPDDPAREIAERVVAQESVPNVTIEFLKRRLRTCSLKCSAIVQAVNSAPPETDLLVLADADVQPESDWLKRLAAAFEDSSVGAVHGNRWFAPSRGNPASLIRANWNAAAVCHMHGLEIPWGGSLAIRMQSIRDANLIEIWSHAIVDDTPITTALANVGQRHVLVPSLMMVNREQCSLRYTFNFIRRQLAWTRLYHPSWARIFWHALGIGSFAVGLAVVAIISSATGHSAGLAACAGLFGLHLVSHLACLKSLSRAVENAADRLDAPTLRWPRLLAMSALVFVTEIVHALAVLAATRQRRIEWRGIHYRIDGPGKIARLRYRPYARHIEQTETNQSL